MTTVRLAVTTAMTSSGDSAKHRYPHHKDSRYMPDDKSPTIRLAHVAGAQGDNCLAGRNDVKKVPPDRAPALLVSFVYLKNWLKNKHKFVYRDWVMDSGAFSAHSLGIEIKLQDYIDCCKRLRDTDPTLTEIFALDVIADWKSSLRNCEEMWRQGIEAIPCFHVGEPEHVLKSIARDYPKIALGGAVGYRQKDKWAEQCFARVWPKRIHGFGFGAEKSIMALPWHSVDATNWEIGPCKFGRWNSMGGQYINWRGSKQNLRAEVEWYLDLEQRARMKWAGAMKKLGGEAENSVRLAVVTPSEVLTRQEKALG
jgi:hypothetical protein